MYLVDTSAWVEILMGTVRGQKFSQAVLNSNCWATGIVLAEIAKWCWLNSVDVEATFLRIEGLCCGIIPSSRVSEMRSGQLWVQANKITDRRKVRAVGIANCLIAAIAEENGLTVLSKDAHFLRFGSVGKEVI